MSGRTPRDSVKQAEDEASVRDEFPQGVAQLGPVCFGGGLYIVAGQPHYLFDFALGLETIEVYFVFGYGYNELA